MTLTPGTRLGAYEVVAAIGAGGMGEVYRAHDTKLGRDVALKILPAAFAADPDRLARFEREAHVLASLNHPNIAAIHGVEEGPTGAGHHLKALVLELVEGETLADRIARGPVPVGETLEIAAQIADALDAAHDHGIIHRDLKPENIKLTPGGTVKVLDFGLAKLAGPAEAGHYASSDVGSVRLQPDLSPTITSPALRTGIGVILGTATYMSPEQARGRVADKRSDIWAFGCLVFEMLTGAQAFAAEDVPATMAKIIEREPDWSALGAAPDAIVRLVKRCLEKDPRNRLRDIGDARHELRDIRSPPGRAEIASARPQPVWRRRGPAIAALVAGAVLGAAGMRVLSRAGSGDAGTQASVAEPALSAEIQLGGDAPLALDSDASNIGYDATLLDVSPDGRTLVYVSGTEDSSRIVARQLGSFELQPLAGTEGAMHVFFSPDGRSVGFLTNTKVKAYSVATGTTATICDVEDGVAGTWTLDNQLFFASEEGRRLRRVSARGGPPVVVAEPRAGFRFGRVTPDGTHALVTDVAEGISSDYAQIRLLNLATQEARTLPINGYDPRITPSGHLIFGRSGRVFAVGFDPERHDVTGAPVPIASGVRMHALYPYLQLAVSATGTIVYVPGGDVGLASVAWVDRKGSADFLPLEPRVYGSFDLSDDGRRLALHVADNKDYILIHDVDRRAESRLRTNESAGWPKWSPKGDALAFTTFGAGKPYRIMLQRMDSDRPPVAIAESEARLTMGTWSADGTLTFYEFPTNRIGVVSLGADGRASAPRYLGFSASNHDVSADGRWLTYTDGGISVRPMAAGDSVHRIAETGTEPRWCRGCGEIVYRNGNRWFSALVRMGRDFEWEQPRLILRIPFNDSPGPSWALSPDGQRIMVVKRRAELPRTTLHVIQGALPGA